MADRERCGCCGSTSTRTVDGVVICLACNKPLYPTERSDVADPAVPSARLQRDARND